MTVELTQSARAQVNVPVTPHGGGFVAGLKIVASVVAYRIRKLEMANLAAATSIALALSLPFSDVLVRTLFAFVLNALVYLNNDYIDIQIDLNSADKDAEKSQYLAAHKGAALIAQWTLVAVLVSVALVYDKGLLVPLIAGGGICFWYSAQLKHRPFLDIGAMIVWGITMPLCGTPITHPVGLWMAVQLGLFSGVFETIQVMRDADEDAEEGVRTTGVVLGKRRTLLLARIQMVLCSLYAALFMQPWAAAVSALALIVPFSDTLIEQYWTRVKLVYGVSWLVLCAWVFWAGQRAGWLAL
jgi:4-hydroxybenzoate polyprenyltransferase